MTTFSIETDHKVLQLNQLVGIGNISDGSDISSFLTNQFNYELIMS
jgi:hypothetical protein